MGTKQMPAGTYTVRNQAGSDIVVVRNDQTGASALALGLPQSPAKKTNKLIFHRYGSQYFLTAILGSEGSQGFILPATRQEKALQVAQASAIKANNVEIASR
jgi:hypothetical protein